MDTPGGKTMSIEIKNTEVLESLLLNPTHPRLIDVLNWVCARVPVVVFTGHFEERDYPSVHSTIPVRGSDIRSWIYKDPQKVADEINVAWIYDPGRPEMAVAIYHDTGRGAHIHLQAHDRTRLRRKGERFNGS